MKRLLALFTVLSLTFAGIWIYKMRTPENRPNAYPNGINGNYWWNSMAEAETEVSTNWKLSEGVPDNYIPVPGRAELYMVVDNDGYITGYKQRAKNDAGEWEWTDVNPDIPENYEAVPGLKDVYKVTADDGTVRYFKYVRNKDDTYAFVEVDAKGRMLGMEKPSGSTVPDNYERVNKNQFAVKNNNGVTIGYVERVVNPNTESGFDWVEIEESDVGTITADALPGFDLNTDITGLGDDTGGTRPFYGDVGSASADDAFAVPTLMPQSVTSTTTTTGTFVFMQPVSETTVTDQVYVTAPPMQQIEGTQIITGSNVIQQQGTDWAQQVTGNMGELPDVSINMPDVSTGNVSTGGNVIQGTATNPSGVTGTGNISGNSQLPDWQLGDLTGGNGNPSLNGGNVIIMGQDGTIISQAYEDITSGFEGQNIPTAQGGDGTFSQSWVVPGGNNSELGNSMSTSNESTGTVTSTEVSLEKVQEGNDMVTYQKVETVKYDLQGKELSRSVTARNEVSRESIGGGSSASATSINKSSLSSEYSRMTDALSSSGGKFNGGVPNELVNLLNTDRQAGGKMPLTFSGNDAMYKIALCRACMMAFTGSNSKDLTGYGSLSNMCSMYGVSASSPSENMLVTGSISASAIHNVFQNNSYNSRMSENYTNVVIAIVEYNGKYYIDEIIYK